MSSIVRATSPEVADPPPGTWSNCLVVDGVAYVAGMTARGAARAGPRVMSMLKRRRSSARSVILLKRPVARWPMSSR